MMYLGLAFIVWVVAGLIVFFIVNRFAIDIDGVSFYEASKAVGWFRWIMFMVAVMLWPVTLYFAYNTPSGDK